MEQSCHLEIPSGISDFRRIDTCTVLSDHSDFFYTETRSIVTPCKKAEI